MNKVKLIDAGFVWTEPHSRRLKVKLTVQKEVFTSTILQQIFVIEFVVQMMQCPACAASFTDHTWQAVVQARQKVDHKRTFLYLEQLILKHEAHTHAIRIKEMPDGLDFYFGHRNQAAKFVDFLQAVTPLRYKTSEQLVSHDAKSNIFNYHYTFSAEIVPICRDDLVCLPRKLAQQLGNICPLVMACKISNLLHMIDPNSLQRVEILPALYWQDPFRAIASKQHLTEFIVLDITPVGPPSGKYVLADVQVARTRDFGHNDTQFYVRTHLGSYLSPGDYALGYDLTSQNFNDSDLSSLRGRQVPDVILVRKAYPARRRKARSRHWKIKHLEKEEQENARRGDASKADHDYEQFMQELEEDPELRSGIKLYKASGAPSSVADTDDEGEDLPEPGVDELIDELEEMAIAND
jgi:nonsense-mediated mRNA decay protein 3